MNKLNKIQEIFQTFFDEDTMVITRETSPRDIAEWDSLAQMNLMMIIEKEFKIKFKINEVLGIQKVGDIIDILDDKLK